ncbi:Chk1 protein kinase [Ascosphaera acerosa]|nr:Chk1 protein kinase [Ascosphaera acerosa]
MQHSQLAPFPDNLPFRIVSRTIGQGAYACIKRACPPDTDNPVFAVKFIHKEYAARNGRLTPRQLAMEVTLHKHIGKHANIIEFFQTGENAVWRWIAMELAEAGDLFDKIEADEGVGEQIAHAYFVQLLNAVEYMHSKGVGHRDIKPENILLSADGNLKIADFGLATLFRYQGREKLSVSLCGSPPYIAPEVITCSSSAASGARAEQGIGYRADMVDVWSCGVVLFVLLVGNTPWDSPTEESYEYCEYVKSGRSPAHDELWARLSDSAADLLRSIMDPDVARRLSIARIRRHPWVDRQTTFLAPDGRLANPVRVATNMFESLHIDLTQDPLTISQTSRARSKPPLTQSQNVSQAAADSLARPDHGETTAAHPSTEPLAGTKRKRELTGPSATADDDNPIEEPVDWDGPPRLTQEYSTQQQQQQYSQPAGSGRASQQQSSLPLQDQLLDEPSMSQFSPTPSVPLSKTQTAQRFGDIVPSAALTKFFSPWSRDSLAEVICQSLRQLQISAAPEKVPDATGFDDATVVIRLRLRDDRNCPLSGTVVVQVISDECTCAEFKKHKGDPLEWRRLFKKVVVLCKDTVITPHGYSQ